jgi:hypothetical protein
MDLEELIQLRNKIDVIIDNKRQETPVQRKAKEGIIKLNTQYQNYITLVKSDELYHRVDLSNWTLEQFKKYYNSNDDWMMAFSELAWKKHLEQSNRNCNNLNPMPVVQLIRNDNSLVEVPVEDCDLNEF